jgi:hypothetical protein
MDARLDAAMEILGRLGNDALPAVPFLIQGLEDELKSSAPFSFPLSYAETLGSITGQSGGNDPDFWWNWWEANKSAVE